MRFTKGSKVEVFSKGYGPSGAWRCGEIVFAGNGHAYSVRYDCPSSKSNEDLVVRISGRSIRPCPPPLDDASNSWTAGDVVEVLNGLYWKTAAILKIFSQSYYFVRLIGSSRELRIHKNNIRVRQLWKDGKWVVIGKGSGFQGGPRMLPIKAKTKVNAGDNCFTVENDTGFQDSFIVTARKLKRASPFWSFDEEKCNEKALKLRATRRRGEHQLVMPGCSSSFMKKVGVAYRGECLGETYMYSSPYNQTIESYQVERRAPTYCGESFQERSSEPNGSDNDECSVGSCSVISNSPSKLSCHVLVGNSSHADNHSCDAESFYGRGDEGKKCALSLEENVEVGIHRLELHAYRCTLEALHASGPLNWEQEVLLTNLRISLNISNDEHLMELRNLISARTSIHIR